MRPMPTAIVIALIVMAATVAQAQIMEATFDESVVAAGPAGVIEGELLGEAGLVDEGVRDGGLQVPTTGGVSYPAGPMFPIEQGCLQMWVKAGFSGGDDVRRWFFCDSGDRFKVFKYGNGELYFQIRADDAGYHAHVPCDWEPGEWHHLACIWRNINSGEEDGQLALYIDGAFAAGASGRYNIDSVGDELFVGCNSRGEEAAESIIDEFQLFAEAQFHPNFPPGRLVAHDPNDYALSALGASATASTQIMNFKGVDYPADVTIDGKVRGSYWASDFIFGTAEGPQWLEIDLGQPREVGRIYLYMVTNNAGTLLNDFTLSVRQDGEWVPVAQVQGYQDSVRSLESLVGRYRQCYGIYRAEFEPRTTTGVRLDVDSTVARVHEIEVLPPAEEAPPLVRSVRGAGPVLKFDFGTNTSVLEDGWLPVTETSVYDETSGYGWRNAEHLLPTDRLAGYPVPRDFVAAAREDGAPVSGTFSVDMPNGEYVLGAVAGDLSFAVEPFAITAEGRTIADRIVTADAYDAVRVNATVTVADGRLDLEMAGEKAWLLNALVIAPVDRLDEADEALTQILDQFAIGSEEVLKGLTQVEWEGPAAVASPTEDERARGYQVFAHDSYLTHIHRDLPPAEGERLERLEMFATAGEREPATFALHALESLRDVRVRLSELSGPATVPADAIELHVIHSWPQRLKKHPRDCWAVIPELLYSPGRSAEQWVAAGQNKQWWLTVHVPEDAPPGRYDGTVTISHAEGGEYELPLRLTVYPFRLDWPRPMHWGIYYYPGRSVSPRVRDLDEVRETTIKELQDLRDHGLNGFAFSLQPSMPSVDRADDEAVIDFEADPVEVDLWYVEWVMDCVEEVGGFEGPFPLYIRRAWMPERDDAVRIIQQTVRAVEDERLKQGWPELLYYPWDEPFADPELAEAEEPYRALAEVEGIRTYCTVSGPAGVRLAPWLDVRCHATSLSTGYQWPEVYEAAMEDGDEYWWYSNCTREFPAVMRFKAGFHHWKSRATGQTYWNYRAAAGPFTDFNSRVGDHITSYPGVDGPIRTIQWECHREGIEDAKYAYTLELLLQKAEDSHDARVAAAADQGRELLYTIRDEAKIDMDYYVETYDDDLAFHYLSDWEARRYDEHRRAIARAIIALLEAGVEQ